MFKWIFFLSLLFISLKVTGTILEFIFENSSISVRDKRLRQLKTNNFKDKIDSKKLVEKMTEPVMLYVFPRIRNILPSLRVRRIASLRKDLKVVGWDRIFTAERFIALSLLIKASAVVIFILLKEKKLLSGGNIFLGIICLFIFFIVDIAIRKEMTDKKKDLIYEFPNLIRVMGSYLNTNMTLLDSAKNSLQYTEKAWKPIIKNFINDIETSDTIQALENMKEMAPIFEAREFLSLLRLSVEQGQDISESFNTQAKKMQEIKRDAALKVIEKRKIYGIVVQLPMLLLILGIIVLPMIANLHLNEISF